MVVENLWKSTNEFFNNLPSTFWAIVFALFVQRINEELGKKNVDIIPINDSNNYVVRAINFFIRLIISFFLGLIFILFLIAMVAILSAFIGFIIVESK